MKKKRMLTIGIVAAVFLMVLLGGVLYFVPGLGMSKSEKIEADLATAASLGDAVTAQVVKDHENGEWEYFAGIDGGLDYRGWGNYSFDPQDIKSGNILAKFYGDVPRVKMGYQYHFQVDSLAGYIRVYITDGENKFLVYPRIAKWATDMNIKSPWYEDNNRMTWEEYEEYRKDN